MTAVATSLGGAIISLAQPAALGAVSTVASQVVPQVTSMLRPETATENVQATAGTSADDYSDLPPFESDADDSGKSR